MKIVNRFSGATLFEGEYETIKACVEAAVKARVNLMDADLRGANLRGATLTSATLTGAYLMDADLAGANLTDAYLRGAYLTGANLRGAYLTDAYLADAYLARANLTGADLAGAYLTDASLRGAYLTDAYLADAYLTGANLTGADLAGAYLTGADLAGAKNAGETNGSEAKQAEPAGRRERQRLRAARFRERNPHVPVIEALDAKMLAVIESGSGNLDMSTWHKCQTTHCRAGWAITLAGEAGKELEAKHGPQRAGAMIYRASTGRVPHFFADDERALEDIRRCAAEQENAPADSATFRTDPQAGGPPNEA